MGAVVHRGVCSEEPRVVAAITSGRHDSELAEHLAGCSSCRELGEVAGWMQRFANESDERHDVPEPTEIWWKAQLVNRWEAERRATQPIETMQRVELVGGAAGFVLLLIWYWPLLRRWLSGMDVGATSMWSPLVGSLGPVALVGVAGAVLCLMLFAVFDRLLAEE
jgi:predicted anti-sigma-YlaC factor YlaD